MELNDLVGKKFYVSVIPEIFYWLLPKAKENKFYITRTFTKDVDGVIEPRKNVLRDNVGGIVRDISRQAFTYGIPYYSLEEVAGLFLDEQFFPVWICNETTFLYNSKSSILYIPDDAGYDLPTNKLNEVANLLGYFGVNKYQKGIEFVVLPTQVKETNKKQVQELLNLVADKNLYAVREDALMDEYNRNNNSAHKKRVLRKRQVRQEQDSHIFASRSDFPDEYIILDTEFKKFDPRPGENLITEIAYIHVKDGEIIDKYNKLVLQDGIPIRSQRKYAKEADEVVKSSVTLEELKKKLLPLLEKIPVVGWNIVSDLMNLAENFEDVFDVDIVDVSEVCEDIMNLKGRMQIVSRRLGVGQRPAHRALNDCYTTKEIYDICRKRDRGAGYYAKT